MLAKKKRSKNWTPLTENGAKTVSWASNQRIFPFAHGKRLAVNGNPKRWALFIWVVPLASYRRPLYSWGIHFTVNVKAKLLHLTGVWDWNTGLSSFFWLLQTLKVEGFRIWFSRGVRNLKPRWGRSTTAIWAIRTAGWVDLTHFIPHVYLEETEVKA